MYFDDAAPQWDTPRRIERAEALASVMRNQIGGRAAQRALEFGCGTGLLTYCLRNSFHEIYGYDPSAEMMRTFKQKKKAYAASNVYPLSSFPANSQNFDCIFSSMVFHHIDDVAQELSRLYELLAPRGILILIDLDEEDGSFHRLEPNFHGHNGFDRVWLSGVVQRCGFLNVDTVNAYQGEKEIAGSRVPYSLFCLSAERA